MGKECGAWVSRRLWGGGNPSPLKTTAWEASYYGECASGVLCVTSLDKCNDVLLKQH